MARLGGKDRGLFQRIQRSGIWWIRYIDATGREHRERVGPKGLAKRLYEKRKTEIREGRYFPPENRRVILVREIVDDYRQWGKAAGRAIEKGHSAYNRVYNVFGNKPAEALSPEDVEAFMLSLSQTLRPASVNRHLQLLRAAYNRAVRAGKLTYNPLRHFRLLKENNIRVRYLSEEEEERLLFALPDYLRPLIRVAIHTGLRRSELLALRWGDIDLSLGVLTVREAKPGEGRRMPLNNVVRKTLLRLHQERGQALTENGSSSGERNGHVFSAREGGYLYNLNRYWYPALRHAGLRDLHFHDLRHTFASRLVMRGVDLYTVQTLLGHKTPAMVQRYAHLSPGHLRHAVEKLTVKVPQYSDSYSPGAGFGAG